MRRILTIAVREYRSMVVTKAFLFTIILMPLLMASGAIVPALFDAVQKPIPKRVVIFDPVGQVLPGVQTLAAERNARLANHPQGDPARAFDGDSQYQLEVYTGAEWNDAARLALSERIRKRELYAFAEVPENATSLGAAPKILLYSDVAPSELQGWLSTCLNQIIRSKRLEESEVDPVLIGKVLMGVDVESMGLLTRSDSGEIQPAAEHDELRTLIVPFSLAMLMFLVILLAGQPLLEAVLEEKADRIAEVLLGSVSSQQLMTGKLLGNVAGSLTMFVLYAVGGLVLAAYKGWTSFIPFHLAPWFVLYQILGVLFFSSIFMAVGAAVSQLKQAQGVLLPVWMLMMLPMFSIRYAIQDPNGIVPSFLSLFPPSAPMMMMIRLAGSGQIAAWQIVASVVVMIVATGIAIVAAARIFQVGILWQGKTPTVGEVVQWLVRNPLVGS